MRTIIISDIHGCLDEFNELLALVEYNKLQDQLILLGDYVDRGINSKGVVDQVMRLANDSGAIVLRGNHDQRLVDLVHHADVTDKFIQHGGLATIQSYMETTEATLEEAIAYIAKHYTHHIEFLGSLPLYYEDSEHIYVHAGINPHLQEWKQQSDDDFMYIKDEFIYHGTNVSKKVVFGHTKTIDIHGNASVWFSEDKIGVDGGCAYGLQLNGLIHRAGQYETVSIQKHNKDL